MGGPVGLFMMFWYDIAAAIAGYIVSCFVFIFAALYILICSGHAYLSGEVPDDMSSFTKTEFTSVLSGRHGDEPPVFVKITNTSDKPIILQEIHYYIYDCPMPDSKLSTCTKDDLNLYEAFNNSNDYLHSGITVNAHETISLNTHVGETLMDKPRGFEIDYADIRAVVKN